MNGPISLLLLVQSMTTLFLCLKFHPLHTLFRYVVLTSKVLWQSLYSMSVMILTISFFSAPWRFHHVAIEIFLQLERYGRRPKTRFTRYVSYFHLSLIHPKFPRWPCCFYSQPYKYHIWLVPFNVRMVSSTLSWRQTKWFQNTTLPCGTFSVCTEKEKKWLLFRQRHCLNCMRSFRHINHHWFGQMVIGVCRLSKFLILVTFVSSLL